MSYRCWILSAKSITRCVTLLWTFSLAWVSSIGSGIRYAATHNISATESGSKDSLRIGGLFCCSKSVHPRVAAAEH